MGQFADPYVEGTELEGSDVGAGLAVTGYLDHTPPGERQARSGSRHSSDKAPSLPADRPGQGYDSIISYCKLASRAVAQCMRTPATTMRSPGL